MQNRLHIKNSDEATKVTRFLKSRGNRVTTLKSGCIYPGGSILEMGDTAFDVALELCTAFSIECKIEC